MEQDEKKELKLLGDAISFLFASRDEFVDQLNSFESLDDFFAWIFEKIEAYKTHIEAERKELLGADEIFSSCHVRSYERLSRSNLANCIEMHFVWDQAIPGHRRLLDDLSMAALEADETLPQYVLNVLQDHLIDRKEKRIKQFEPGDSAEV